MSRGIVEAAARSVAFRVRPGGLAALLAELGRIRGIGRLAKKTYLVREGALLVELPRAGNLSSVLPHLAAVTRQPFVNYPVYGRDIWSPAGHDSGNADADAIAADAAVSAAVRLRRQLQLEIVPDFNWPAFRQELLREKSLSGQILTYYNRRLLGKPQLVLRTLLATGINSLLQSLSAGTALKIVGSLRTGTSFDKSDCDMNLWFYDDCCAHTQRGDFAPENSAAPERMRQCLEAFGKLKIVALRNVQPAGFNSPTFPNRVFLAHLGLLLRDIDPCVADLQCHTGALVPVIRARHEFLGFHFDVSLNTRFNHKLNYLVSSLSSACPPFTPLLIIIKGICKESRHRLIDPDDYSGQLTTFKLTALLIYFLQGCGYAPPLSRLLSLVSDPSQLHAFASLPAAEAQRMRDAFARNARNLETLLKQFLRFLIGYDFAGKAVDLLNFLEVPRDQLPAELQADYLVVLNPTADRPTNITRNIKAEDWKQHCAVFSRVLELLENPRTATPQASDSWGLVGLFDFPETQLGDPECDRLQKIVESARSAAG